MYGKPSHEGCRYGCGEIGGWPGGGGVDVRPYLSPSPSSLDTWDGLALSG
jgi:hypothetical protein